MNGFRNVVKFFMISGILTMTLKASAQSKDRFDAFLKRQQQEFSQFRTGRQAEFNRYREQYNREFANFLRKAWKQVQPEEKVVPPPQPTPFVPKPTIDDVKPLPKSPMEMPVIDIVKPRVIPLSPKPIVIEKPKEEDSKESIRLKSFYGNDIHLRCCEGMDFVLAENTQSAIAAAWEQVAAPELDPLVYDCQQARVQYRFCDWMYYQFVKEVAHVFTGTAYKSNEEVLLTGYILAQSGVDFRFVRNANALLLALPFDSQIYGYSYFTLGNRKYYVVEKDIQGSCSLMDRSFGKEPATLTLRISSPMDLGSAHEGTRVLVSRKYPEMKVELKANKSLMDFYHTYPRMDWQEYALAPMNDETFQRIADTFKPVITGKNEEESVNMLLNFVQTAFKYGYDNEIWGGDRPFFSDETLYYPYSDCEDRSILFSYLVRKLTGLDVVLLHYPNHLATAVRFGSDIQGDYVMLDGQKYLVCDPTGYKPIGNAYEEFKNVQAKVIRIQ